MFGTAWPVISYQNLMKKKKHSEFLECYNFSLLRLALEERPHI